MLYETAGSSTGGATSESVLRTEVKNGKVVAINTIEGNSGNRVKVGFWPVTASDDIVWFINPYSSDEQPTRRQKGAIVGVATGKLGTR